MNANDPDVKNFIFNKKNNNFFWGREHRKSPFLFWKSIICKRKPSECFPCKMFENKSNPILVFINYSCNVFLCCLKLHFIKYCSKDSKFPLIFLHFIFYFFYVASNNRVRFGIDIYWIIITIHRHPNESTTNHLHILHYILYRPRL